MQNKQTEKIDLKDTAKSMPSATPFFPLLEIANVPIWARDIMGYNDPISWTYGNNIDSVLTYADAAFRHLCKGIAAIVNLKIGSKFWPAKIMDDKMPTTHFHLALWNAAAVCAKMHNVPEIQELIENEKGE